MPYTDAQNAFFAEFNPNSQKGRDPIPFLKEGVLAVVSRLVDIIKRDMEELRKVTTVPAEEGKDPMEVPMQKWGIYDDDKILNAAIYAFNAYRRSYTDRVDLPNFGSPISPLNEFVYKNETTGAELSQSAYLEQWLKNAVVCQPKFPIKGGKKDYVTIKLVWAEKNYPTNTLASIFVFCMCEKGIFPNIGMHMSTFNKMVALMTLHQYRFKELWYQEAGNKKRKTVTRKTATVNEFEKFSAYGLPITLYHFSHMINYPLEIKGKLRDMTGVGTDLIDFIELRKKNKEGREVNDIVTALKKKLPFWSTVVVDSLLKHIDDDIKNNRFLDMQGVVQLFLSVVQMKMPVIKQKFCLPVCAYVAYGMSTPSFDFSAQGAFSVYMGFRHLLDENSVIEYDISVDQAKYAFCSAFLGLVVADQRMISVFFKDMEPKQRHQFTKTLKPGSVALELNELKAWSKAYNGEEGRNKSNQASVLQCFAAQTKYKGDDFIIDLDDSNEKLTDIKVFLLAEHKKMAEKYRDKVISFGTQKLHSLNQLKLIKQEIKEGKIIDFSKGRVVPFYSSISVPDDQDLSEDASEDKKDKVKEALNKRRRKEKA